MQNIIIRLTHYILHLLHQVIQSNNLFHTLNITMFGQERTTVLLDANEVAHVEYESVTACEFDT